jgi:hypothetical protein
MTFAFEIISAHEIHRHPGESCYRHWTFLIGKLLFGSIKVCDRIAIPSHDDKLLAATVLGFEPNIANPSQAEKLLMTPDRLGEDIPDLLQPKRSRRKLWQGQLLQSEVKTNNVNRPFVIVTWAPAHTKADIQVGSVATGCSQEIYKSLIIEMLQREPECLLHCTDCAKPLSEISEAIPYLQQLLTHPNIKLVSRAIKVLSRKGLYPKFY